MTDYTVTDIEPDEVIQFVTHEVSYIAYTRMGRRLDILKSTSVQPTIADEQDYYSYLWVKALQGYFVLRQRYVESIAEPWHVISELEPETDFRFYEEFLDVVEDFVTSGDRDRSGTESS